jgi:hypothetical protein
MFRCEDDQREALPYLLDVVRYLALHGSNTMRGRALDVLQGLSKSGQIEVIETIRKETAGAQARTVA